MNVGIVTFHCSYNFGSALQAYALQTVIEKIGHTATIIDYRSENYDAYKLIKPARPKNMLRMLKRYSVNKKRKESFERFWGDYFNLTPKRYSYKNEDSLNALAAEYDAFTCGSDQIWNLDCTHGIVPPFFLSFAGQARRVAYAPSLAHTSFSLDNFDEAAVARYLAGFHSISVRERETVPLFQPLTTKKIEVVLDPTLLLDAEAFMPMAEKRVVEGDYLFCYLLRSCPELLDSVCALAASTGIPVVYISDNDLPIPGATNLYGVGPTEFVSLIAHAKAVMTNSFHASVFSVLFRKQFRVFATDKSGSRMIDLLGDLCLSDHCSEVVDSDPIPDTDWEGVQTRLDNLRAHSVDYLRQALS